MAYREPVFTPSAAAPLPQFSQAVKYNGMVYCSGSIGIYPLTDDLVAGTVTDRTRTALQNLKAILQTAGSSLDRVVKANVFLADMNDFSAMNVAWDEYFPHDPKPVCYLYEDPRKLDNGTNLVYSAEHALPLVSFPWEPKWRLR